MGGVQMPTHILVSSHAKEGLPEHDNINNPFDLTHAQSCRHIFMLCENKLMLQTVEQFSLSANITEHIQKLKMVRSTD